MNFLPGTLGAGGAAVQAGALAVPVPGPLRAAAAPLAGAKVVAGVRPENVVPPGRAPRGEAAKIDATVEIVETLGDEIVVHARAGDHAIVFEDDPHHAPDVGAKVGLQLELEALHLFDAASGRRIEP